MNTDNQKFRKELFTCCTSNHSLSSEKAWLAKNELWLTTLGQLAQRVLGLCDKKGVKAARLMWTLEMPGSELSRNIPTISLLNELLSTKALRKDDTFVETMRKLSVLAK